MVIRRWPQVGNGLQPVIGRRQPEIPCMHFHISKTGGWVQYLSHVCSDNRPMRLVSILDVAMRTLVGEEDDFVRDGLKVVSAQCSRSTRGGTPTTADWRMNTTYGSVDAVSFVGKCMVVLKSH